MKALHPVSEQRKQGCHQKTARPINEEGKPKHGSRNKCMASERKYKVDK